MKKCYKPRRVAYGTLMLLTVLMLILLTTVSISSASEIVSVYTEGDTQGQSGQNVNVKIMASGMNNVGTIAVGLVFDNSVLSVNSISDGNVKTPDAFSTSNINNAQGVIAMGLGNPSGMNGDGTLFVINFKVIGSAGSTSNLKLSITANDITSNVIDTSATEIKQSKFTVLGEGGSSGGMEPYDNILKYEIKERAVSATPITFTYTIPESAIYEVVITSAQSGIALLRMDALKDTSKIVGTPAPGIVYKNNNLWIDFKRVTSAFVRYKVENTWITGNSLSTYNVKMLKWDNNNKRWIELLTTVTNKDGNYTYFESRTDTIPASLAIASKMTVTETVTPAIVPSTTAIKPVVIATPRHRPAFDVGMLVYAPAFKSESYATILDKLVAHNITRIIVPIYEAKKRNDVHIFHAETKGLGVKSTGEYSLDKLLTEAHNRSIDVYVRISVFGPDAVVPSEEQKQNVKKIIRHLLDNYTDDKGAKLDGIFLDHIYYEEPQSAEGNTDVMANFVKDINAEVGKRTILSASVKPSFYESILHVYFWPYTWPISGPSDYYNVKQEMGQDYAKLSRNLDSLSPISYNADNNYAGKVTKFIIDKAGVGTRVIPNVQALGETVNPNIQYMIESAKNNGAKGVNIFDYSSMSDSEWQVLNKI